MSEPSTGHNSVAKEKVRSIVERVERLNEQKKTITDDIGGVFTEAKSNGLDVKALRTIVRMRAQDAGKRAEQEQVLELYMHAMGMI